MASVVAGRREVKRLDYEHQKEERAWERSRAERFLDLKRELYSEFGGLAYQWSSFLRSLTDGGRKLAGPEPAYVQKLSRVVPEIELVAPRRVSDRAGTVMVALLGAVGGTALPDATEETIKQATAQAESAVSRANRAMRADLRGDAEGGPAHWRSQIAVSKAGDVDPENAS